MKKFMPWPKRIVRQNACLNNIPCAVLVPVIEKNGEEQLLFEVRSSKLAWQPGEICFPGGRIEPGDANAQAAALRETQEELGVVGENIHVWGPLDYLESPVGVTIWPFAARLDAKSFTLSKGEIDHLFSVPLSWFSQHKPEIARLEIATRPTENFPPGLEVSGQQGWKRRRTYNVKIYTYGQYKIWGITAHILDNFLTLHAIMGS